MPQTKDGGWLLDDSSLYTVLDSPSEGSKPKPKPKKASEPDLDSELESWVTGEVDIDEDGE